MYSSVIGGYRHWYPASDKQIAYIEKLCKTKSLAEVEFAQKILERIEAKTQAFSSEYASHVISELLRLQKAGAAARRGSVPATDKQLAFIRSLVEERKDMDDLFIESVLALGELFYEQLDKSGASSVIESLLKMQAPCKAPAKAEPSKVVSEIPLGTYTVVLSGDESDYVTLRVERESFTGEGKLMISYLAGSDNTCDYVGFAFLTGTGVAVWKKYRENSRIVEAANVLLALTQRGTLGVAKEKFYETAEAYALMSGNCMRCGRELTVPTSLHRGLGPKCAEVEGL